MKIKNSIIILLIILFAVACESYPGDTYDFSNALTDSYIEFTSASVKVAPAKVATITLTSRTASSVKNIDVTLKIQGTNLEETKVVKIERLKTTGSTEFTVPPTAKEGEKYIVSIDKAVASDGSKVLIGRQEGKTPKFTILVEE